MSVAAVAASIMERMSHQPEEHTCLRTAGTDDAAAIHALIVEHPAEGHLLARDRRATMLRRTYGDVNRVSVHA